MTFNSSISSKGKNKASKPTTTIAETTKLTNTTNKTTKISKNDTIPVKTEADPILSGKVIGPATLSYRKKYLHDAIKVVSH